MDFLKRWIGLTLLCALFAAGAPATLTAQVVQEDPIEKKEPVSPTVRYRDASQSSVKRRQLDQKTERIDQTGVIEIRKKDQNASVELSGPEPYRPPIPAGTVKSTLNRAWSRYEQGDDPNALLLFSAAAESEDAQIHSEARLGLALTLIKRGKNAQAISILEELVAQEYRLSESLPALIRAHMSRKNLQRARELVRLMPSAGRTALLRELESLERNQELKRMRLAKDRWSLIRGIRSNERLLSQCRNVHTFLQAAQRLAEMGETEVSVSVFRRLLPCTRDDENTRIEILRQLAGLLPLPKALDLLDSEEKRAVASSAYRKSLEDLKVNLLKERLARLPVSSPEFQDLAGEILEIHPRDQGVRTELAWACYNSDNEACALKQFQILHQNTPDNNEVLKGLCRSLIRAERTDEALALLDKEGLWQDLELHSLRFEACRQAGTRAFENKEYARAEGYLSKACRLSPSDPDVRNLLAWSRYHLGDFKGAQELFLRSFKENRAPEYAENVLLSCDKLGERKEASHFTARLAQGSDPGLRKIAADRYNRQGRPILAARTYSGTDTCYVNCDAPWLEGFFYYRARTGDPGLSRLTEISFPFRLTLPVNRAGEWSFTLKPAYLDSGEAPPVPYAGSFYATINNPGINTHSLEDSAWVFTPAVRFRKEGSVVWEVKAGSTPIGAPVGPMPTFTAGLLWKNNGFLKVYQCPVKESLLSYSGQQDPYSDRKWGRVLKTGARAGKTLLRRDPYWLSLDAGYDYLWGKNTVDNHKVSGTASAGRTAWFYVGELSLGLFATAQHLERNTGFYTFGHGGYFSPDVYVMAGPFARFVTKRCNDYWFDVQVSAGYVYYETEDAPQYHKTGVDPSTLTSASRTNLLSRYEGETKTSFGISARLQGLKLVHEHWALGGFAGVNTTTDHTEYQAGLTVRYYFQPRKALCFTDELFEITGPCN